MAVPTLNELLTFIEPRIQEFHERRLQSLKSLRLNRVLLRKNPYLFKAKNIVAAQDLVKALLDAHLSSQEEALFGEFLEQLAIFVCERAYGGRKSSAQGVDLEFEREGILYLVSIKSGPNWGNSRQIAKMRDDFRRAMRVRRTNATAAAVVSVNGCCYGRDENPDKGDYQKLCGQRFWEFISGDASLYTTIVEPIGYRAKQHNEEFVCEYVKVLNVFTRQFIEIYCRADGSIDWPRLVKFNSGKRQEDDAL